MKPRPVQGSSLSVAPDGTTYVLPRPAEIQNHFKELSYKAVRHQQQDRRVVVVQGLGFVGAAVAAVIAGKKLTDGNPLYFVIGVDLALPSCYWKVGKVNDGECPYPSPDSELNRLFSSAVLEQKNLMATSSEEAYSLADIIVVDVPLDITDTGENSPKNLNLNLDAFEAAIRTIGRSMKSDALVIVETTMPIGTMNEIVLPILKKERELRGINHPIYLAHVYERVMPGPNYAGSICRFWRTFSGIDHDSALMTRAFLESFVDVSSYPLCELETPPHSEMAKLLENSYRAVNIAFIYEWTLMAETTGINLFAVIDSIRVRKGTHDNIRYPGFGVGGYCLPKDPLLAQWSLHQFFKSDLVLETTMQALEINRKMPLHTFRLLTQLAGTSLSNQKVVVCGLTYLPEVPDTRNSPTEVLVDKLCEVGARVLVHDPIVTRWNERPRVDLTNDLDDLRDAYALVFAVPHLVYRELATEDLLLIVGSCPVIVDAQNILSDDKARILHNAGCRIAGVGKGHWRTKGYHHRST